jgi:anti-sigma-K factor RskA
MTTELEFDAYAKDEPDADLMLVADYLGGFLSAADKRAFEERMIDDERFFLRMAPFLAPWAEPDSLPVLGEVVAPVEAAPVAQARAAEVDIPRRRRTKGLVATAASAALQIKIVGWLATATAAGLVVALLQGPATSTPQQIFVQLPPTVVHDTVRVVVQSTPATADHQTARTHHVPVTEAAQPIDVVPLPTAADSAMERAVAEMVARALPEGGVTPSATTKPGETVPQVAWVPHIWVEADTNHSLVGAIKDKLVSGIHGAVALIAKPIDFIRGRKHHDPPPQ